MAVLDSDLHGSVATTPARLPIFSAEDAAAAPRPLVHLPLRRRPDHPRFHLEGIQAGRTVKVFWIDPGTGERLDLLAAATVGDGGWVDLQTPIVVRAGEAFIAVPEQAG